MKQKQEKVRCPAPRNASVLSWSVFHIHFCSLELFPDPAPPPAVVRHLGRGLELCQARIPLPRPQPPATAASIERAWCPSSVPPGKNGSSQGKPQREHRQEQMWLAGPQRPGAPKCLYLQTLRGVWRPAWGRLCRELQVLRQHPENSQGQTKLPCLNCGLSYTTPEITPEETTPSCVGSTPPDPTPP